ncbi:MAG: helix-turn-helix domain-containing protein [Blautia sp.]|nr:helix-turn-helix domain-containing protein [Eubacteriales bacterium]MED9967535.1 helix-turn-helix domain-containing protein [Blautia sp.]
MKKIIVLSTKKELEIYMSPCRQEILRELRLAGEPVTPKFLADRLKISPSSIQFHLKKLETLGIVSLHHTELIRGITAKFYVPADVDISIGCHLDDFRHEREIVLENMVHNVFQGCCKAFYDCPKDAIEDPFSNIPADIFTGIAFLTENEITQLRKIIFDFLESHSQKRPDTYPWEYSLLAYKVKEDANE